MQSYSTQKMYTIPNSRLHITPCNKVHIYLSSTDIHTGQLSFIRTRITALWVTNNMVSQLASIPRMSIACTELGLTPLNRPNWLDTHKFSQQHILPPTHIHTYWTSAVFLTVLTSLKTTGCIVMLPESWLYWHANVSHPDEKVTHQTLSLTSSCARGAWLSLITLRGVLWK